MRTIARVLVGLAVAFLPSVGYADQAAETSGAPSSSSARTTARKGHAHGHKGPTATMPGFQMTEDGGSRLFVRLSAPVPVQLEKGKGTLSFVLKGAHVATRNNLRALETVHFATPVVRARLVPKKGELVFVVDLRNDVTPTWKVVEEQDKTATLVIDFPKVAGAPSSSAQDSAEAP